MILINILYKVEHAFHFSWIRGLLLLAGNRPAAKIPVPMPPCRSTKSDEVCLQISYHLLMDFVTEKQVYSMRSYLLALNLKSY